MTKTFSKHVMAILMVMIMAVSMFAATAVVASADEVDTIPAEGVEVTEEVIDEEDVAVPSNDAVIAPQGDEAPIEETVAETVAETAAETQAETVAETTAETTAETVAATVAPTVAPKNANTPKTGDNMWLFIGIGIVVVAIIAIVITVVAKKKAK